MSHATITNLAWVLPRPRRFNKYIGGFPEYFEKRIYREVGIDPTFHLILHPFGGMAEIGYRVDIRLEVRPSVVGDAHRLPFKDETFDCVLLDPPYNEDYAKRLYGTENPKFGAYTREAVRVLRKGGILIVYHYLATPSIPHTRLVKRIFLETRMWHKLRCIHIHEKCKGREWSREPRGLGLVR